ncbi:TetR/AcrR family transcriptional regulator [Undibacterium sp. CY18W]|uniref:TetR/AcrR family transcriptional regulator n=1 Tax=Undibacterium hunanense TaxID=2762292 RepID=A0ABR6ZUR4_9BURK|nr:TetR/AcrR family transcriptional regulator [Undibacterium hunanense]MBC3919621.1 TetR/AcrR family transcriptional regulator [Undibacterium hunanense]
MKLRTEARRNAILVAATDLFKEMGYERASMNELAKRLGGSKATLYGYFMSKEELFAAVVQAVSTAHLLEAVAELSANASNKSTLESQLRQFGERMMQVVTNDQSALAVCRMVVAESGHSDVGQVFYQSGPAEAINAIAELLKAAMERGELRQADPKITALQFMALVTAENDMRLFQRDPPPVATEQVRAMVDRAIEAFLRGAQAR